MESIGFKLAALIVFAACVVMVIFFGVFAGKYERFTLFFINSRTGKEVCEPRYVFKQGLKEKEVCLVEELMLGPMNHDFFTFTAPKTKYNACFVRENTLYVDLPQEVFTKIEKNMGFKRFFELFEKNIFTNSQKVDTICMYLDGIQVYEENSLISE